MSSNKLNTMDLENLQQQYSDLLIKYKASVSEYILFLNEESKKPCLNYTSTSKGISQDCYDYIWSRSGCSTNAPSASSSWAQGQTLNDLIYDSFLWATMTDQQHRTGCYGNSTSYSNETSPNYNINQPELVSIQGQAYLGTDSAGQSTATTLQDCIASCASNSKCTGATFISNKCDIRTGDSEITTSSNDSYAIIPKSKQLLLNIENINQQLLNINKEINDKIEIYQPEYYKNTENGKTQTQQLLANYENLTKERESILEMLNQYETLDRTDQQNQIKITQNYYSYILLVILAIAVLYLLYKFSFPSIPNTVQYGGDLGIGTYYFIFVIILAIIVINFLSK